MDHGAINKQTLQYVLPDKATKSYKYKCPDCNKDLILCKGKIRNAYFRHKVDKKDPCTYYTNPSETQIHKDGKLRFKELGETKHITINRYCCNCKKTKQHSIPEICEKSKICIEHRFEYNESYKFADVAFLKDGNIEQIYEIYHTHKTREEDRPEPWFEFNAKDIIELSKKDDNDLEITCIRDKYCDECKKNEFISKIQTINNLCKLCEYEAYVKKCDLVDNSDILENIEIKKKNIIEREKEKMKLEEEKEENEEKEKKREKIALEKIALEKIRNLSEKCLGKTKRICGWLVHNSTGYELKQYLKEDKLTQKQYDEIIMERKKEDC